MLLCTVLLSILVQVSCCCCCCLYDFVADVDVVVDAVLYKILVVIFSSSILLLSILLCCCSMGIKCVTWYWNLRNNGIRCIFKFFERKLQHGVSFQTNCYPPYPLLCRSLSFILCFIGNYFYTSPFLIFNNNEICTPILPPQWTMIIFYVAAFIIYSTFWLCSIIWYIH